MFRWGQTMYVGEKNLDCGLGRNIGMQNAIASGWMHIWDNGRGNAARTMAVRAVLVALTALVAGLVGCASPGPPLAPSLKLPEIVSGTSLTATRVGGEVRLYWTTPTRTTDKLLIAGPITAEICRETVESAGVVQSPRRNVPCSVVGRVQVAPGASDAVDALPGALVAGPVRLLAYRVQLRNSAGRTAGPSAAVFAASGPAPQPIENWGGKPSKIGAVLEWKPEAGGDEAIELDRTLVESPAAAQAKENAAAESPVNSLLGAQKEPAESRLRVDAAPGGAMDAGGTIDRGALIGRTYRYTAQRVRSVAVGGQTLEVRSVPTPEVTVAMRADFSPDAPAGLVAVPGFSGETDAARRPAIDLSWDPNAEPRIAGYRVYRRDAEAETWQRLNAELVGVAAYRDASVAAGHRYAYRVSAVNVAGIESARSEEVVETAPEE